MYSLGYPFIPFYSLVPSKTSTISTKMVVKSLINIVTTLKKYTLVEGCLNVFDQRLINVDNTTYISGLY